MRIVATAMRVIGNTYEGDNEQSTIVTDSTETSNKKHIYKGVRLLKERTIKVR